MMNEQILPYVLQRLDTNKGQLRQIAKATGVPYSTVSKIAQRVTPNPGVQSVQALADYFRSKE